MNGIVLIPAYNEGDRIGPVVQAVRDYCARVVVVDDGSTDNTVAAAEAAGAEVLRHEVNRGKGAALNTGFAYARSAALDFVITMDADGQHDPCDLPHFLDRFAERQPDVIMGNRMDDASAMPLVRRLTNRFMSGLLSRRMGQHVPDTQNGYRLYKTDVIPDLREGSQGFAAESEILLELARHGITIDSVPVQLIYGNETSKIHPVRDTFRFFGMLRRFERDHADTAATGFAMSWPVLILRSAVGGVLMGLANLVPGISGGTMLLASGIYPHFIEAIAAVTGLRFRLRSLTILAIVIAAAGSGILLLAGGVKTLVVEHRWVMYSLFIGLTLGGIPVVWGMLQRVTKAVWWGAGAGFAGMAALAIAQASGAGAGGDPSTNMPMLVLAGLAGAAAMILPGVSGGYLLLVLGQYIPILSAVDKLKLALRAGAMSDVMQIGMTVVLPVGIGVVVGVVVVSHALRFLLHRFENATLGVLLGLLLGAVVGLWPFQAGRVPEPGDTVKGRTMTPALIETLDPEDYPTAYFRPTGVQIAAALGLILAGWTATYAISRLGRDIRGTPNRGTLLGGS